MATHHRGPGQPLDRDDTPHGKNTEVNILHDYHHKGTGDFENEEQENHTNLATPTRELDNLHHTVQAGEDQPLEGPTLHRTQTPKTLNSTLPIGTTRTS